VPSPGTLNPRPKPPPPRVIIVGGGLAGLAAAIRLVDRGLQITLLESRPRLGGRASSFPDPATGELVDNCQHVSMACCTNLADFMRRVGISSMMRREKELLILSPEGKLSRVRANLGPAPLHLARSFLSARFLSVGDKVRVGRALARLVRGRDDRPGESVADWLARHGQSPRAIELFWATILVSSLNERLDQMDVGHARKVFLDEFCRNRTGFQLEIPLVPLGELYGVRLETWLADHGVTVRLTTGVAAVVDDHDGAASGVTLRSGESLAADFVVLAVPFDRLRSLVPEALQPRLPALTQVQELRASPITGVHLWFDRPVCPFDHVATPGRLIQWVFNHTAIQGRTTTRAVKGEQSEPDQNGGARPSEGQYLQVVISASHELLTLDKLAIRDAVLRELGEIWPAARAAEVVRSWVVTEHGATFAVRPGVEAHRPRQRTPIDGLFLAGDWTDTGWPPTMEGAVRSGYLAAEGILTDLDRPTRLVRPGLKTGLLARWLFGAGEVRPARPEESGRAALPATTIDQTSSGARSEPDAQRIDAPGPETPGNTLSLRRGRSA
jgi:squalene-associated FAD-dependent desaturase